MLIRPISRLFTPIKPISITRSYYPVVTSRAFSISSRIMAQEWKLKGIDSLSSIKDLQIKEAEVEGIEKGKVVIVNVGGELHALNANCTHFGAPLAKGIVRPDGRLTCPWHGACFNVKTGDVEDAPAPDHLNKFDVFEKDGNVYIKGAEKDIKSGKRTPTFKVKSSGKDKVVIVGGGSGAFGAVQKLREHGFTGSITVIGNEGLPIDRTKLSKALITDASKLQLRDADWYKSADVDFVKDTVSSIDFKGRTVSSKSGSSHNYTKLILASGGTPKVLPLPGFKDLKNIFTLRRISDTQAIMNAIGDAKGKNITVVGSSFIGMEAGNFFAKDHNVTIIGMESAPLENIMGKQVGGLFQKTLEKNGAKFYMNAEVDSAVPSSSVANAVGMSSVAGVKLKDGTVIDSDLVILGVGVSPGTEYLKENSDVSLEKDGSLRVDEGFAVQGLQDVYAIGDIATYPYHGPGGNGKPVRIEHWNVAQNMGRGVGQKIANPSETPKPFVPIFWSALGGQLRYCGHTPDGFDDVVIDGSLDVEKPSFAAYYTKGDDVVAVATMQKDPIMAKAAELMREGKMFSRQDVKEGKDILQANL